MITTGMMSSLRSDWETPPEVFDPLDKEFEFTLDVCATATTAKCRQFYTPEDDALVQQWRGVCWMNPPYGRQIGKWVKKAYESDCTVVCLVPARTDTAWWHDYCMKGEIRFLRGRIYFWQNGAAVDRAPFPSAVVIFYAESEVKDTP